MNQNGRTSGYERHKKLKNKFQNKTNNDQNGDNNNGGVKR